MLRKIYIRCFLSVVLTLFSSTVFAYKAYVGNFADNTLSVIDSTTNNKIIKTLPMSPGPADMALSPDKKYLYVSDSNDYD